MEYPYFPLNEVKERKIRSLRNRANRASNYVSKLRKAKSGTGRILDFRGETERRAGSGQLLSSDDEAAAAAERRTGLNDVRQERAAERTRCRNTVAIITMTIDEQAGKAVTAVSLLPKVFIGVQDAEE